MTTIDRPNRELLDKALLIFRDAMRPFVTTALEKVPNIRVEDAVCEALPFRAEWRVERIRNALARGEYLIDQIDTSDFPVLIGKYWNIAFKHRFTNRDVQAHCQLIHNVRNQVAHVGHSDIGTEATRVTLFHIAEVLRLIDCPLEQASVHELLESLSDPRTQTLADEIGQLTSSLNTQALEIETLQTSLDQVISDLDNLTSTFMEGLPEIMQEAMQKGVEAALAASDSNIGAILTTAIDRIVQGDSGNESDTVKLKKRLKRTMSGLQTVNESS